VISPRVFDITETGKVVVLDETPPPELRDEVDNAAFACPAFAITVDEA
jgi:ferredoxin